MTWLDMERRRFQLLALTDRESCQGSTVLAARTKSHLCCLPHRQFNQRPQQVTAVCCAAYHATGIHDKHPCFPQLQGWLFNVYLTQISSPDNARHAPGRPPPLTVHRHCIAHSTCVDKDAYILVPSSLEDPSPTPFISPAALLPWLHAPIQLYGQWLRLEAYSLVPRATKVVDGLVYMGDLTPSGSHGTGSGHASGPGLHGGGGAGRHGGVPEAPSLERVSAAVQLHLAAGLGGRRLSEATGI